MKRISMTTIAAISAIFAACSCGNGENTSAEVNLASLSGTYSGYSLATCQMFTDMLATDQTLTVTDNGDETLSISYTSDMFGEFSMPSCTVTASDGTCSISGSGNTVMGMGGSTSEYEASLKAVAGNGSSEFTFSVPSVMGGLTIVFHEGAVPPARAVAGSYTGTFDMTVAGSPSGSMTDFGCTIAYVDDNTVGITLDEITAMGNMTLSLSVDNVAVTATDSGYSLSGDIDTTSGSTKITGTVSGTITSDGTAAITFEFKPGAMPMNITGVFSTASTDSAE